MSNEFMQIIPQEALLDPMGPVIAVSTWQFQRYSLWNAVFPPPPPSNYRAMNSHL